MRRFGLSDTQIEFLRDSATPGGSFPRLKSTGEKLLSLRLVKMDDDLSPREKGWKESKIERLRKQALRHLAAGRVMKAYWLLDAARDAIYERDSQSFVATKKGLEILTKLDGEIRNVV